MNKERKRALGNPNPRNPMQAFFFVRSLSHKSLKTAPFRERCTAIRRAAYASMARSSSPRRAWRRAVLSSLIPRRPRPSPARLPPPRDQHDDLRRLIPGGEAIGDLCKLLEETIDYVSCLRTQVQLMQEIADSVDD
ncbi:hypothetical protein KSP39_PZI019358 [Platanthera zijinensis]|uniref:Uncharacterized protein n=1 Tax=Platanthera zijinensis TaxID=2320716 RepID=A0AAP0B2B1_9ASPA